VIEGGDRTSYRVKVRQRELPPGRVSLHAVTIIMNAIRIAVRAEAAALGARNSMRGRLTELQRESVAMSLVGVETGSGILVLESEARTLLNIPGSAFDRLIAEANSARIGEALGNPGMQRALLALEGLFRRTSDIDQVEFISERGDSAQIDYGTIARIKTELEQRANENGTETFDMTGRLLELDLARKSFRVHGVLGDVETVVYADILEPLVVDALDRFVTVRVAVALAGQRELVSLEELDGLPETRFQERRTLEQIASEQGVSALHDIASLAIPDAAEVPLDDFKAFIKALRRGGEA
jgi:hypothetical protein